MREHLSPARGQVPSPSEPPGSLGGFSATNFRDLSKGVTAPQKDCDLLRAYLQRRPAVKRREGPGGFFDNHREVSDQAEIASCPQGRSCTR